MTISFIPLLREDLLALGKVSDKKAFFIHIIDIFCLCIILMDLLRQKLKI